MNLFFLLLLVFSLWENFIIASRFGKCLQFSFKDSFVEEFFRIESILEVENSGSRGDRCKGRKNLGVSIYGFINGLGLNKSIRIFGLSLVRLLRDLLGRKLGASIVGLEGLREEYYRLKLL